MAYNKVSASPSESSINPVQHKPNPYSPPKADLINADADDLVLEAPEEITKKIKNCWKAGLVSIVITLLLTVVAIFGAKIPLMSAWSLIDVLIMSGLTYGIYKNSRICAVLLLAFFVLNNIIMWSAAGNPTGLPMALIFFWFFWQGVVGTFQLHRLKVMK